MICLYLTTYVYTNSHAKVTRPVCENGYSLKEYVARNDAISFVSLLAKFLSCLVGKVTALACCKSVRWKCYTRDLMYRVNQAL